MRPFYFAATLSCLMTGTPALAGDTPFTPDAAATWSMRSLRMAEILNFAPGELKGNFKRACDGLTGEQMKHEYGKEPRWALSAQLDICLAYDGFAGKFQGSHTPCKSIEKGIKELDQATAEAAPTEVVEAARSLQSAVAALLHATQQANACKL